MHQPIWPSGLGFPRGTTKFQWISVQQSLPAANEDKMGDEEVAPIAPAPLTNVRIRRIVPTNN